MFLRFLRSPDEAVAGDVDVEMNEALTGVEIPDMPPVQAAPAAQPVSDHAAATAAVQSQPAEQPQLGATAPADPNVAAPAPQNTAAQAAQHAQLLERMRHLGYDPSGYENDDQALIDLLATKQQYIQSQQQQELYRQQQAEMQRYEQAQAHQRAVEEARAKQFDQYKAPEWNPEWLNMVARDEAGNPVLKPGAPPDTLQKIQAFTQWKQQTADKLLMNPREFLKPILQEEFKAVFQQEMQERSRIAEAKQLASVNGPYRYYLYEHDQQTGQVRIDPRNGQPVSSPYRMQLAQRVGQLVEGGVTDQALALHLAVQELENGFFRSQQVQPQQPAQQQARQPAIPQPRPSLATQAGAAYQGGNATPNPNLPGTGMSLEDMALQALRAENAIIT